MQKITPVDALKNAIDIAGGQSAFASRLPVDSEGKPVSTARVWNWVNRDMRAPAEFCPDIELITGVPCEELCPGTNWSAIRNSRIELVTPQRRTTTKAA